MSVLFTCLVYAVSFEYDILTIFPLLRYLGIIPAVAVFYVPAAILFTKIFFEYDLPVLPDNSKKSNLSRFLATFVITPGSNHKQTSNPIKSSLVCFFLKIKTKILIKWSSIFLKGSNFKKTIKLPKYVLWRPLFKKSSYYGLFVHARTNFLKFFK